MVYNEHNGRRMHFQVHRPAPAECAVGDSTRQYIRQVADEYPRFTPAEVHAEIHHGRGLRDISIDMVRSVLD
jgi:hypothetical protein